MHSENKNIKNEKKKHRGKQNRELEVFQTGKAQEIHPEE